MARRHASQQDFETVGMDSDPTPGDPDLMQGLITRYRDVGDAAEKALNVLKRDGDISRGRGEAIDALNKKIGDDLPDKLRKTATSYHDAAQAYTDYAPRLREAQETFDRAVDQANSAAPQANQTPTKLSDAPTDDERAAATRQQNEIDAGKSALGAAKSLAEQARQMRESAQRQCEDVLDRAAREAIPERNVFQKIADFFKDFPFVKILLGVLAGIVALIFPVVGALLGGALFAIDQISAIASGHFSLGDFAVGLLSFIPGGSILKGIGGGAAKFLPNITKNVDGSIKNIKSTIDSTKTVGGPLGGSFGSAIKHAGGDFAESAAGEAANQAISGDGFDAGAIFGAGAAGAAGGALTGGGRGKGKGNPPPIPIKNGSRGFDVDAGKGGNGSGLGSVGGKGGDIGVDNSDGSGVSLTTSTGDVSKVNTGRGGDGTKGGKGGRGGDVQLSVSGDGTTNVTLGDGGDGTKEGKGGRGGGLVLGVSGDGTTNVTLGKGGKGIGGDAGSAVIKIHGNGPVNVTQGPAGPPSSDGSNDGKSSSVVIVKHLGNNRPSSTTGDGGKGDGSDL